MNVEKQNYANAIRHYGFLGNSRTATQNAAQNFASKSPAQDQKIAAIQVPAVNEAQIRSTSDSFGHHRRPAAAVNVLATGVVEQQRATRINTLG